jgi:hypothetical protein
MSQINLSPQVLDLIFYAGDGANFRLLVKDSNGDPVPLTGSINAQIRMARYAADPPNAEFNVDMTQADQGIIILSLTGEQTADLMEYQVNTKKFSGVWDVQWTPDNSEPRTLVQGKVECNHDVSR